MARIDPESCWTTFPRKVRYEKMPPFDVDAWFRRLYQSRMFDPPPDPALAHLRARDLRTKPSWLRSQLWFRLSLIYEHYSRKIGI